MTSTCLHFWTRTTDDGHAIGFEHNPLSHILTVTDGSDVWTFGCYSSEYAHALTIDYMRGALD